MDNFVGLFAILGFLAVLIWYSVILVRWIFGPVKSINSRLSNESQPTHAFPVVATTAAPVDGPGLFRVDGVDRESKLDTSWTVRADSQANAQVKAELEGIIVTRITRIE
jgi:hypothetical protein